MNSNAGGTSCTTCANAFVDNTANGCIACPAHCSACTWDATLNSNAGGTVCTAG